MSLTQPDLSAQKFKYAIMFMNQKLRALQKAALRCSITMIKLLEDPKTRKSLDRYQGKSRWVG